MYSSAFLLFVIVIVISAFGLRFHAPSRSAGGKRTNAMLRTYPLVGDLPGFIRNRHRFLEWSTEVLAASPTLTVEMVRPVGFRGITTANPRNVEHILRNNFTNYPKGEEFAEMLRDFLGDGIFNADGETWKGQRKTASFEFNTRSLRNFVINTVREEISGRLAPLLARACVEGRALDLQDVLERFAFDNVCRVAFGEDPACLRQVSPENSAQLPAERKVNDVPCSISEHTSLKNRTDGISKENGWEDVENSQLSLENQKPIVFMQDSRFFEMSAAKVSSYRSPLANDGHEEPTTQQEEFPKKYSREDGGTMTESHSSGDHLLDSRPFGHLAPERNRKGGHSKASESEILSFQTNIWRENRGSKMTVLEDTISCRSRPESVPPATPVASLESKPAPEPTSSGGEQDHHLLNKVLPENKFARAFEDAAMLSAGRFLHAFSFLWKIKRHLNLGSERRLRDSIALVHGFATKIIRSLRVEMSVASCGDSPRADLLSRFVSDETLTESYLRDIVVSFILAGRDTTSSALTWFFWLLSCRPDIERKILEELASARHIQRQISGIHDVENDEIFGFDELRDMHYLQAAISESMRLYPPVPVDTKHCLSDDVLPDGSCVRKGWFVAYNSYAMGRMREIWGDDCLEFRPERWLSPEGLFRPESPFRYPVFHAGPRVCLGREMAYIQMKSVAAFLLERYEVEVLRRDAGPPPYALSLTLRMNGGLPVRLRPRPLLCA
ncbi:Cytochrome P450 94A1 [Nymphaea thermarum]|nr:Cytochrome P450 94A1 [Nymphaea thermarum]